MTVVPASGRELPLIYNKGEKLVFITGATGFVGSHLTSELLRQGHRVRVLVRDPGAFPIQGVEIVEGDVTLSQSLANCCSGVDTVVHLVAVIRERAGETFREINYQGTVNILKASKDTGVRRFIYLSALGATDNPGYKYACSKWEAEEAVRSSGLNWTIIRPSVIYGRGFGFFNRVVQALRISPSFMVPVPGKGNALFQPIAVEDVISCILRAIEDDGFGQGVYEVGGPQHVSYAAMVDTLLGVLGQRRVKVPVPLALMKIAAPLMGLVFRDPPVTPVELKQLELNNVTDKDAVLKNFGFKPRDLKLGLEDIRDYLKSL